MPRWPTASSIFVTENSNQRLAWWKHGLSTAVPDKGDQFQLLSWEAIKPLGQVGVERWIIALRSSA
jgi:hypothetical protein